MRLLVLVTLLQLMTIGPGEGGSLLLYMPFSSRSVKMTYMPMAEMMADRGHEVVVVMPIATKKRHPRVREIIFNGTALEGFMESYSRLFLAGGSKLPFITQMYHSLEEIQENALGHPEIHRMLREGKTFDVCVVGVMGDAGLYLARKFNASPVMYFSAQASMPYLNEAIGQPHNPAHVPFIFTSFGTTMSFLQRYFSMLVGLR